MKWDHLFSSTILNRGRQYYNKGLVQGLRQNGSNYTAEVIGSVVYDVSVQLTNENRPKMTCDCPYADDGNRCKHMAAVLYAIEDYSTNHGMKGKKPANVKKKIFPFAKNIDAAKETYQYYDMDQITNDFTFYDTVCEAAKELVTGGKLKLLNVEMGYVSHAENSDKMIIARGAIQSGRASKLVTMMFDRRSILSTSCHDDNCSNYYQKSMYGYSYWKKELCVHQTALLFLVDDYLKKNSMGDSTDRTASHLLMQYRRRNTVKGTVTEDAFAKKVNLEPRLEKKSDCLYVSFRIGAEKMYVVKNLSDLVDTVNRKGILTLGSKSELNFGLCEFTDAAQKYYDFIWKNVQTEHCRSQNAMRMYRYYEDTSEDIKGSLMLYGERLDDFFELVRNMQIPYVDKDGRKKEGKTLAFKEKDPKFTLTIQKDVDDKKIFHGIKVTGRTPEFLEGLHYRYYVKGNEFRRVSDEASEKFAPLMEIENYGEIAFSVGRNNLSEFYYRVLPLLRDCATVVEQDVEEVEMYLPPEVTFAFYLDAEKENVSCLARAKYGEQECSVADWLDENNYKDSYRDSYQEQQILNVVQQYFPEFDKEQNVFHCDRQEDAVYKVLEHGVDALLQLGEVNSTERFRQLKIRKRPKVSVGVSVESDIMNLTISSEDLTQNELLDILYSYQRKKKYYRLKSGDFLSIEDESLEELAAMLEALHVSPKEFVKGKMQLPLYRALYLDKMLEQNENIYAERNSRFKNLVKEFKTVKDSEFEVPTELLPTMRNYQAFGHKWLRTLEHYGFGGILADDMGLGKTLQMISVILAAKKEGKKDTSLIITPASLVYNWQEEFKRFAPRLSVVAVVGNQMERKGIIEKYQNYDVLITSYDLLKRDIAEYEGKKFYYQIIDEAQYIKNHTTAAAKSVKVIRSRMRFALTGTPIENRLSELWSIFDYLMPGFLYGYDTFKKELETPITKNKDEDATKRLKRMVSPFILRRLKQDVLKDLPDKMEEVRYAKMDEEQQHLYDAQVLHMRETINNQSDESFQRNKLQILAELTKIRQICCDPSLLLENYKGESAKREACMELIRSAIEGEHKVLIFSQFTSMLELLEQELAKEKIAYYKITGATPKEKRVEMVHAFNENEIPIFLISLKAGGTGLNLTGADVVIHYDPWWNLAVQNQATDRAHRIGQTKVVSVYKLIVKNTIEEKILLMQASKKNLADEILSGENGGIVNMSKQEVLQLLEI
uniref:SNF2 helicase associated domain-containing protein n=1 Tax=Acetatifactor sp. TaxID=1872090 RepID=UPI004057C3B6